MATGNFGTLPVFVQLSDKPLLASTSLRGKSEPKTQCGIEKLCAESYQPLRFKGVDFSSVGAIIETKMNAAAVGKKYFALNAMAERT